MNEGELSNLFLMKFFLHIFIDFNNHHNYLQSKRSGIVNHCLEAQ